MSKRFRTFIAVEITPTVRDRLARLQDELREVAGEMKWVEPKSIHLTLNFLGEVDDREVYAVCKAVQQAASELAPFEMCVSGAGAFPNARRPRTLWASVTDGATELGDLHAAIDLALEPLGFRPEARPFEPHLTIGRVRHAVPNARLEAALNDAADWVGGQFEVREVVVYSSELRPDGPEYAVMGRCKLRPNQGRSVDSTSIQATEEK